MENTICSVFLSYEVVANCFLVDSERGSAVNDC